jgi:hypothetical protein
VSVPLDLQAFTNFSGQNAQRDRPTEQILACPFETYLPSHPDFTMTSVAFPKSIFSNWAADLPRRACRTGESITMSSKARTWIGFRSAVAGMALHLILTLTPLSLASMVVLSVCAPSFGATAYYISKSSGLDSNTSAQAKSKATPWAHLPGMASCTSNCGSYTPTAGDTFILMGCDVWVNTDLPVLWNWSGASGSLITITVDKTWYNTSNCPSAWNRPVFDAQKTVLSPDVLFRAASSGNTSYVTLDNIEMRGLACAGTCSGTQNMVACYNNCTNWTFSNLYLHGWNIVTDGNCFLFQSAVTTTGTTFTQNVIDGSDATGALPPGATCNAIYPTLVTTTSNNVIHDLANGIVGHADSGGVATINGNLIYNIAQSNAGNHPNAMEIVGGGTYYIYNNVVHDAVGESLMFGNTGEVDYVWNNLWYNILGNTPEGPQTRGQTGITSTFWNNTIVPPSGGTCIQFSGQPGGSFTSITIENTHCISTGPFASGSFSGTAPILNNNVLMTPTIATAQGYTASQTYAYSPTSSGGGTVGAGKTICGVEKTCAGDLAALANDTVYSCTQQTVNGVVEVVCPARAVVPRPGDVGAFQYAAGGGAPAPPTSLAAVVQ